ncbi:MAG: tetratricopeptide repeat protein, partial [Proteiniphilum sp.]|nr:tetratricopeptide repeat protein [Proteiniphilum sp.]
MHFKNRTIPFFLTLGFMLVSISGTAQNRDSLENLLNDKKLSPVTYLNICDELSWSYLNDDFGKAKRFALQGIERARSENIPTMEATLYRNLGVAYYMNSQMDSAQLWLSRSLDLAITLKDEKLEAAVYGAIGNLHNVTGAYQEALSYYLKALSMFESQGNNERIRSLLGNIGTLYHSLLNLNQAEKYYLELEKESKLAGDTYNLGRAYDGLSRIALREKDFDKSLGYSISAAEIFHNSNQQLEEAIALQGIAMVYYSHYRDYPTAKEYALRALKLTQESGYPAHIAGSLNILSNIHFNEKDYQNCRQSAREAIRIDTTDANVTSNLYANMVRSGIFLDNNEEALHYFDKYRALIDERSTQEFELSMAELEKKYETEKKEMRISSLERERKLYGIILFSALFILVLLLLMVWFRQKSIRSEKRLAEQKILHLEQEKQIVATQAVLDGETAERTRLARDLHDGLGGMLSAVKLNLFDMRQDVIIET